MTPRSRPPCPERLIVGPLVYDVSLDAVELGKHCRDQGTNLFGTCDHPSLKIVVDPDQAPGQARESLLHEALHAVFTLTGLADELGEKREEAYIRRLSPALLDLIRSNRPLVAYLMEDC